jgi:hypothetical protein
MLPGGSYHRRVAARTLQQLVWRRRIERGIRLAAPALDALLAAGDRLSRVVARDEPEPEPARRPDSPLGAPRRQA